MTEKNDEQQLGVLGDSICTLVGQMRNGCSDSREELMQQLRSYMRVFAASRMNNKFQSKFGESDVVQQSIAVAIEKFDDFRGESEGELFAWVAQILRNEMSMQQRALLSHKRDLFREQLIETETGSGTFQIGVVDNRYTPQTNAIRNEQVVALASAMAKLPDDYREVIQLRNQEQLSFAKIGERMNRSENAVTKLWYRALIHLKRELEAKDD